MSEKKKKTEVFPIDDLESEHEETGDAGHGRMASGTDEVSTEEHDISVEQSSDSEPDETGTAGAGAEVSEEDGLATQLEKMTDHWQRERADFINYKKRVDEEKRSIRKYACFDLVFDLLRVVDYFESSVSFGENIPEEARNVILGVEYTLKELNKVLSTHGVLPIETREGSLFDSFLMEVVERRERADLEPGTILDIQRSGWKLHNRLLRSAQVIVSFIPDGKEEADTETEGGDEEN